MVLGLLWCNTGSALDISEAKNTCKDIGFITGTEKFADCTLKLMLQDSTEVKSKEDTVSVSSSTQDQQYGSAADEFLGFKCEIGYGEYETATMTIKLDLKKEEIITKREYEISGASSDPWKSYKVWIDGKTITHKPYSLQKQKYMFDYNDYKFEYYLIASHDGTQVKKLEFDHCKQYAVSDEELNSINESEIAEVTNVDNISVSDSSSTQDQQYNSTLKFPRIEKNKFYYKQLNRYSKMPETELCISYINAYGWHKREIKQAIKYEVLETRGINCDRYMDVAYYDKRKRDGEMADSLQKVFNSGVNLAYGVDTSDDKSTKRTKRNCITGITSYRT